MDLAERDARRSRADTEVARLAEQGVVAVATSFVDNSGISRVKTVPLDRLPDLAAWGVGCSTSFDFFRFDDWLVAPATGTGPVGDLRIVPDLDRLVVLAAQPGWAWAPGERFAQDGTPYPLDGRQLLRRLVDDLAGPGVSVWSAIEIEWVLSRGGRRVHARPSTGPPTAWLGSRRPATTAETSSSPSPTRGWSSNSSTRSTPPGSSSCRWPPSRPVHAADTSVLVRSTIRALGMQYGLRTSFSPKVAPTGSATAATCT